MSIFQKFIDSARNAINPQIKSPLQTPPPKKKVKSLGDILKGIRNKIGSAGGEWSNTWNHMAPQVEAKPPVIQQPRILDVGQYQGRSTTPIPLPEQNIQDMLWEAFPQQATASAIVLAGENATFDPWATNYNTNGSIDLGMFQNNDRTLQEMLYKLKYKKMLNDAGIFKPEDVLGDAMKAVMASKATRAYEDDAGVTPWNWWYGWQNKGYDLPR